MNISIEHPTNRPNYSVVNLDGLTVWFSYRTPIAFRHASTGRVVRQNDWSATTGKHLNAVDHGDKASRVTGEAFCIMLEDVLSRLSAPVGDAVDTIFG